MKFLFEGREERIDSLEKLVDLKDLEIKQIQTKLNDLNEIQNCRDELDITKSQNEILNEKLNIRNSFIKKIVNSNSRLFKCYMEMLNEITTDFIIADKLLCLFELNENEWENPLNNEPILKNESTIEFLPKSATSLI
ncbi:unnamed protein product, partial [Brachionus calyciflorus]